jgi:hypothetical protein
MLFRHHRARAQTRQHCQTCRDNLSKTSTQRTTPAHIDTDTVCAEQSLSGTPSG